MSKFDLRLLDKKVEIDANTIIYDNNAAAIAIDRNDVLPYGINNKYPHITLATSTNVRPVYSNTLMILPYTTISQKMNSRIVKPQP